MFHNPEKNLLHKEEQVEGLTKEELQIKKYRKIYAEDDYNILYCVLYLKIYI